MVRVIAEAGTTMEGSTARAIEMVEAFADAGAWGFKVQLLRAESIATAGAPVYWANNAAGYLSQREAFSKGGLVDYDDWWNVQSECVRHGVEFIGTPFDLEAAAKLHEMGCGWVKIASGDITWWPLLDYCGANFGRVIVSTGAATLKEITDAYDRLHRGGAAMTFLACTLAYPCPSDQASLGRITELLRQARDGVSCIPGAEVGYSDHTLSVMTGAVAAAAGATMLEKHVTWAPDGRVRVADHAMGLAPGGFGEYVRAAEAAVAMMGGDFVPLVSELAARAGARRTARYARPLRAGDRVGPDDVTWLRPDDGDGVESIRVAVEAMGRNAALCRDVLGGATVAAADFGTYAVARARVDLGEGRLG